MDHSQLPINQVVDRLKEAAQNNEGVTLSAFDVQVLIKGLGKGRFIPVYTNDQIVQLCKEGKLGQKMVNKKNE